MTKPNQSDILKLFQKIKEELNKRRDSDFSSIQPLLELFLNTTMEAERAEYLKTASDNRANGHYDRTLATSFAKLNLKVPRVRKGNSFRPSILPSSKKRVNKEYEEMLLCMIANGYSESQLQTTLHEMGLPFSRDSLNKILDFTKEKMDFFRSRPLKSDWFAIFIDGFHTQLRTDEGQYKEAVIYSAVGVDLEGKKEIIRYWVKQGKETKSAWIEILQDLISRGATKVLLFITDDFPGITGVLKKLFPYSDHQLCTTHLRRNLKGKLPKKLYKQASDKLSRLQRAENEEEGKIYFEELVKIVGMEQPRYAKYLQQRCENYTPFLKYPHEVRRHIYTTNPVEGLNAGLENMRRSLGGYFPSERTLFVNLFIQAYNLQDMWNKRIGASYLSCRL